MAVGRKGRLQAGAGIGLVACLALLALIWLVWAPGGSVAGSDTPLVQPGAAHWLGTDQTGRDVAASLMSGTLTSLLLAWFATLVSLLIGIPAGIAMGAGPGQWGGRPMMIGLMPGAIVAGVLLSALQVQPTLAVFVAIGVPGSMAVALGTGAIMAPTLRAEYFAAARLAGLGWLGAAQRHIVPMVMPRLIAMGLDLLAAALLIEVTLSYAGLGVTGDGLSLGTMLRDGQAVATMRPVLVIAPGLVAVLAALALLVAADGLRLGRREGGNDGPA